MRIWTIALLLIAMLVAGAAAYMAQSYLSTQEREARREARKPEVEKVRVLVSKSDLKAGSRLNKDVIDWQGWPREAIGPDFVVRGREEGTRAEDLMGAVLRTGVPAGLPLRSKLLLDQPEAGDLPGMLSPGMRAVAISISPTTSVAGFVQPGDRVDVVLVRDVSAAEMQELRGARALDIRARDRLSEVLMEDVRILAIDRRLSTGGQGAPGRMATVEVPPADAQRLILAADLGELYLVLRSLAPGRAAPYPRIVTDIQASPLLSRLQALERQRTRQPRPVAPTPQPRAAEEPPGEPTPETRGRQDGPPPVKVYRGSNLQISGGER